MALLDGKKLSKKTRQQLKDQIEVFKAKVGRAPALAVLLVGNDPASEIYVGGKIKACQKTGIISREHRLEAETSQEELLAIVKKLAVDDTVDGILVQLPLPDHIDENAVIQSIPPDKDVDGFHPVNLGKLVSGLPGLVACTPLGCMKLLEEAGVEISGKNAVVIGRSTIVGKPLSLLLLQKNATVTICHSRTEHLAHLVAEADIVVAAVGKPEVVKGDWIKKGAVVIDVGINRREDGSIVGDVEFDPANSRASWITPVPGGVGPMTIASLLLNTVQAARARAGM